MRTSQILAFDTETHLFSNGNMAPPIVCLQWDSGSDRQILVGNDILPFARQMLKDCAAGLILEIGRAHV